MYNLKDKIEVTRDFLNDLIAKNWQEAEALQHQAANIDTSTRLGAEVVKLLKNTCTNYYVLIGCLENLAENRNVGCQDAIEQTEADKEMFNTQLETEQEHEEFLNSPMPIEQKDDFEPFEYFVDFD